MRIALDPGDRSLLIVSGVLLAAISLAGVLLAPPFQPGPTGFPSSYSTGSQGGKAAYLLLEELGYDENRWTSPPTTLPEDARHVVLILADPLLRPSSDEKLALQWFVRRGGRVLATGPLAASLLNLPGIISANQKNAGWKKFPARLPGPTSRQAPSIFMNARSRWKSGLPADLVYYGDEKGGTVVRVPLGNGAVVWWADSSPLTNYGLKRASNLNLLLNSVGEAKDARVLWDEYYHGERSTLWSYLVKTPLPWALLQAALLALAVVLTFSRRSGPLAAIAEKSRLSPMEFVETVGDLYARKRAAAGAIEIAVHRFRTLLARRLGVPPENVSGKLEQLLPNKSRRGGTALAPLLAQCDAAVKAKTKDEGHALQLVQELHDYTLRLRLAGKGD
jgi:hypothetical protein